MKRWMRRVHRLVSTKRNYRFIMREWTNLDIQDAAAALSTMRWSRQLEPVLMERPSGRRILVIAPHPDDEAIGPGGTLLKAIGAGARVRVLSLITDQDEQGTARASEAHEAAALAGWDTRVLGIAPGTVLSDLARKALREELATFQPDTLFIPFMLDDHHEHREANRLLLDPELDVHPEIWAYQVYTPLPGNVVVDITAVSARKAEVIRMWRSSAMRSRDWAHFALGLNAFNCRFLPPPPGPRFAETFFVLPADEYRSLVARYFDPTSMTRSP